MGGYVRLRARNKKREYQHEEIRLETCTYKKIGRGACLGLEEASHSVPPLDADDWLTQSQLEALER